MSEVNLHLRIAAQEGEIALLNQDLIRLHIQAECFIDQMWFWRSKYLKEHPEKDTWEYAVSAYTDETGKPSGGDHPPSSMHQWGLI